MVIMASLGFVFLPAVRAAEDRLVSLGELLPTAFLVVLVAHQAGEVGCAALQRWGKERGEGGP